MEYLYIYNRELYKHLRDLKKRMVELRKCITPVGYPNGVFYDKLKMYQSMYESAEIQIRKNYKIIDSKKHGL